MKHKFLFEGIYIH